MRNYLSLYLTDVSWITPTDPFSGQTYVWGRDEEEMEQLAGAFTQSIINQGGSTTINSTGKAFPLMDKAQVFALIQTAGFRGIPYPRYVLDDSPRATWKPSKDDPSDNPGTGPAESNNHYTSSRFKAGTSDLSGAAQLIINFLQLMNGLIAQFKSKGDLRTVGILQYLLKQFLDGQQSITDILDELRKLFII